MNRIHWGLATVFLLAHSGFAHGAENYIRVLPTVTTEVVGIVVSESSTEVRILDLKTLAEKSFQIDKLKKIERQLSDDQVSRYVGLANFIAFRISKMASAANNSGDAKGKIAQVTLTAIYITLGKDKGIRTGQKLSVFRSGIEIKDPDTGAILARERPKLAEVEVFEVSDTFCKARLLGNLEVGLKAGDEVEGEVPRFMVAVTPIADDAGVESGGATAIREEAVTWLVKHKVPVVERSQLDKVLGEGLMQNTGFFDAAQAQKLGQQLGASMVVTGKIVSAAKGDEVHLRLVNVATGEITLALSAGVGENFDKSPTSGGSSSKPRAPTGKVKELIEEARKARLGGRDAILAELGDTKDPAAAKFLAEEMLSKDYFAAESALIGMGTVGADALAKVIETGEFTTQMRAFRIFTKVATKKHIPALQKMARNFHMQSEAQQTIKRLQAD